MYTEDIQRCRAGHTPPKLEVSGCPHNSVYHSIPAFAAIRLASSHLDYVTVGAGR